MRMGLKVHCIALGLLLCIAPQASRADVAISINIAPPPLPVYTQPPCPQEGWLWTPGYWSWGPAGYYWVPGVWVAPPRIGFLWTPGYWAFANGVYLWRAGYWGPHVGFYGGVNYGFGYVGVGFVGGVWAGSVFRYNTAVVNVNTTVVHNVYIDRTVIRNTTIVNRASFNGPGGIAARPTPQEQIALREQHFQPTPNQVSHERMAAQDRSQLASLNQGRPATAAMDSINGRRFNQQGRIANGIESGRLTPNQASNLERREGNVNREIQTDRQANGGRLSPQERQQVTRQQNNLSRSISRDQHTPAAERRAERQTGQERREPRREER
ncbi:MAG: YXWGXW repeat-containing protein [Acidobacteriia bacterium]|nr:YXWGXW repeat-containing protein [Terriglobia bacterium]